MKLEDTIRLQAGTDDNVTWITVNGQHIPIKEGQNKEQAIKDHFDKLNALPKKKYSTWSPAKEKEKVAKYLANPDVAKKVLGVWKYDSNHAKLYKALMAGDWHKVDDLKNLISKPNKAGDIVAGIGRTGKRSDLFSLEWKSGKSEVRLLMKDFGNAAKGQVDITDQQQHAALTAVSKLITNTGLSSSFSEQVLQQFANDAGISSKALSNVTSMVSSWVGWPTGSSATELRKIASDYYGRPWNSEYSGKSDAQGSYHTLAHRKFSNGT